MILRVFFRVIDCLNTIYDMQNEKEYFYHYNESLHIQGLKKVFQKLVHALLVFQNSNNCLHSKFINLNTFSFFD